MGLFGLSLGGTKTSAAQEVALVEKQAPLATVFENRGGWWPIIRESFTGAWQRNIVVDQTTVLAFHAVYACMTLIAADVAKLRVKLVRFDDSDEIWVETTSPAFSPVLRRPNRYQTRIQFWECYILSKLQRGNVYVLKERDGRGIVVALYILDPNRVTPMVAADGGVFYSLQADNLSGLEDAILVPASEIIHDRMNCLFHPLVGVSPIYAAGLAATQGLNIQESSSQFFQNRAMPGGIITAPSHIPDDVAGRLKDAWTEKFTGTNSGRVAVLGDGLTFEPMIVNSVDAQLIEQLKWTAEVVCSVFHVPPYKIGMGQMPTNNNVQSLNVEYYSQCLQHHIESAEECLDEGLGIGWTFGVGTEFDIENLLRMDTLTQIQVLKDGVIAGLVSPNEGRKKLDYGKVKGGESPYLQKQNYSLEALSKRDKAGPPVDPVPAPPGRPAGSAAAGNGAPPDGGEPNQRAIEHRALVRRFTEGLVSRLSV